LLQIGQAAVFHINHIVPKSRGGVTEDANLALQCPYCSLRKSAKLDSVDPQSGDIVPLFHPLKNRWQQHFTLDEDGKCRGLTAIGRATVDALGMNDPLPLVARALQIQFGFLTAG